MKKLLKLFKMLNKSRRAADEANVAISSSLFIGILIGVLGAAILGFLSYKYADMIDLVGMASVGGGASIIFLVVGFLASIVIVVAGFMMLINSMYMSSDIEVLITLPFSATEIAVLRVLSLYRVTLAATLVALLAPYIGYALATSIEWTALIGILIAAILIPTFAISIVAIIVVLIMSFFKIFRNRQVLKIIGTCFLFVAMCAYLFVMPSGSKVDMVAVAGQASNILKVVKYTVPVIGFLSDFVENGNILNILFSILCTIAVVVLFVLVTKAFYLKGALNMQDGGAGRVLTDNDLDKYCKKKTVSKSLFEKEYRMVRRNSTYLLNNFIIGALWPVVIVLLFKQMIPLLSKLMSGEVQELISGPICFGSFALVSVVLSFASLIAVFMPLMMQNLAFSSISREGSSFPIMKQLPVSYETQLEAKRKMAGTIAQVSITGYTILIMIVVSILLKFSILYCILPVIIVYVYTDFCVSLDMYFGIRNANVTWDNEKLAINKPLALALISYVIWIGIFALAIALSVIGLDLIICLAITIALGVLMFVASLILKNRIKIEGEKRIRRLRF